MEHAKQLMQAGDVQGAADELKMLLATEPENVEVKMLYGTCCHLLGDDKTFGEIHDALAPKMDGEKDVRTQSLWRKYHTLWMNLLVAGLVVASCAGVAVLWGDAISKNVIQIIVPPVTMPMRETAHSPDEAPYEHLYGGPSYQERTLVRINTNETCQACLGAGLQGGRLCASCGGYGNGEVVGGNCESNCN